MNLRAGILDISKTKPSVVSKWEQIYGDIPIENLHVCRVPLQKAIEKLANVITLGKYAKTQKEMNYDHYYHLYLVFQLQGGNLFNIEKNERVKISTDVRKNNETCVRVPYKNGSLTFKQLIRNAEDNVPGERLWYYNAIGVGNGPGGNCQDFIIDLLNSSRLLTPELRGFIKQDIGDAIKKDSIAHKIINLGTNLKNRIDTFFQGGSINKNSILINKLIHTIEGILYQNNYHVQAIIFDKNMHSIANAKKWLKIHKFVPIKPVHSTENYYRFRLSKPSKYEKYRTKDIKNGIKLIIAYKK